VRRVFDREPMIYSLSVSGNTSMVGGSNANLFDAGRWLRHLHHRWLRQQHVTSSWRPITAGNHDFVTNLSGTDLVGLIGYNPAASAISVANGSAPLTLSDNTQITFVNVTDIANNIHYSNNLIAARAASVSFGIPGASPGLEKRSAGPIIARRTRSKRRFGHKPRRFTRARFVRFAASLRPARHDDRASFSPLRDKPLIWIGSANIDRPSGKRV